MNGGLCLEHNLRIEGIATLMILANSNLLRLPDVNTNSLTLCLTTAIFSNSLYLMLWSAVSRIHP